MRLWDKRRRQPECGQAIHQFRRRFAKFLICLGLIYIGAAIASAGQSSPRLIAQQLATIPAASESAGSGVVSPKTSVLGQSTVSAPTPSPFIPECTYRSIPYQTVYKTAAWLTAGQTITTGGMDGEEKVCTSQFGPSIITNLVSPLDKTITTGTFEPQTYSYPGYTNSDGDYIPSPNYSGEEVGGYDPSAVCGDGSYSYSQHASGTCSSHGGVASWLDL